MKGSLAPVRWPVASDLVAEKYSLEGVKIASTPEHSKNCGNVIYSWDGGGCFKCLSDRVYPRIDHGFRTLYGAGCTVFYL